MTVKMILCSGLNGEIGYSDGRLAFNCPEDMKYFRKQTLNEIVIIGRKTFDSIGIKTGLPHRINHIVTNSSPKNFTLGLSTGNVATTRSLIPLMEEKMNNTIWIIGGASIYEQFLDMVDEIHQTVIQETNSEADVFFDTSFLDNGEWSLTSSFSLSERALVNVWKRNN